MTMSRPDTVASPLTVKEQFEASANRFWSSVKNLNAEDALDGGNEKDVLMRNDPPPNASGESLTQDAAQQVSFQSVIHAVFGSCTTGVPYEGYSSRHSRSTRTTISPTCSREGGSTEVYSSTRASRLDTSNASGVENPHLPKKGPATSPSLVPTAPKAKFFQDSRERAEEAVMHLREQQQQQNQDLRQQHQQNQRQKEYEKVVSSRGKAASQQDCSNKTASPRPSRPNVTKQESLAFFPVSKPSSGRDPPGTHHAARKAAPVPKEVSSPPRRGLAGKSSGVRTCATTEKANDDDDEDIFDFQDDGISVITQETVDRMVRDMEEQQKDFPNDFLLNRVCSDVTDPVNRSFGHWQGGNLFRPAEGDAAASASESLKSNGQLQAQPREGRYMTPPRLTRQNRSSETRSLFTKTTHSTDPDDFNAWRQDEQQYWDSLVAKEESTTTATDFASSVRAGKNSSRCNLKQNDGSSRGNSRSIPPSPASRSSKLKRVRDKVKRNVVRLNAATVTTCSSHTASQVTPAGTSADDSCLSDHDRRMDVMLLESEVDMAEI